MRETLIDFIVSVNAAMTGEGNNRQQITVTNGVYQLSFGYGYFDKGKVMLGSGRELILHNATPIEGVDKFLELTQMIGG